MQKLVYFIIYPLIWSISKLPFTLLYRVSDFFFLIVYYLIGYRKKVVLTNLKLVFPDKSDKELLQIRRKFYRHFTDIFMEIIKTFTITEKELDAHYQYQNLELLRELAAKKKSIITMGSHYANWEWALKFGKDIGLESFVVYAKIRNEIFNKKIVETRERFGINLVVKADTFKMFQQNQEKGIPAIYGFLSDQSPRLKKAYYWTDFLGQRVPVLTGAEILAKKHDTAIVFMKVDKIKRGYYTARFELVTENPREYPDYEITEKYLDWCEKQIREKPEYYFWTHNRFKFIGKESVSPAHKLT